MSGALKEKLNWGVEMKLPRRCREEPVGVKHDVSNATTK